MSGKEKAAHAVSVSENGIGNRISGQATRNPDCDCITSIHVVQVKDVGLMLERQSVRERKNE